MVNGEGRSVAASRVGRSADGASTALSGQHLVVEGGVATVFPAADPIDDVLAAT
jgi:hypothetical protein